MSRPMEWTHSSGQLEYDARSLIDLVFHQIHCHRSSANVNDHGSIPFGSRDGCGGLSDFVKCFGLSSKN